MRTSPVLGRKAWFGPQRLGWGLQPVSIEGWAVTLALSSLGYFTRRRKLPTPWIRFAVISGYLLVAVLKGAAPGGARARAAFDTARKAQSTNPETIATPDLIAIQVDTGSP
jgi:hypothetical protein